MNLRALIENIRKPGDVASHPNHPGETSIFAKRT